MTAQLIDGNALSKQLRTEVATRAQALKANADQSKFIQSIDPQQDGKYQGKIGGQPATKAQPGSREPGDPAERFAQPHILLEAPCDISHASPASTLLYAGKSLHLTSQQINMAHLQALAWADQMTEQA